MTDLQTRQPLLNDEKAMLLLALNNYIFLVFSSVSTFVNHKNSADDLCCYNFQQNLTFARYYKPTETNNLPHFQWKFSIHRFVNAARKAWIDKYIGRLMVSGVRKHRSYRFLFRSLPGPVA